MSNYTLRLGTPLRTIRTRLSLFLQKLSPRSVPHPNFRRQEYLWAGLVLVYIIVDVIAISGCLRVVGLIRVLGQRTLDRSLGSLTSACNSVAT